MKNLLKKGISMDNFLYNIIENMQDMVRVMDSDNNIIFMNKAMRRKFGDLTGCKCYEMINVDKPCIECICKEAINSKCSRTKEVKLQEDNIFRVTSTSFDSDNQSYAIEVFKDISVQKKMETGIYEQYLKMKSDIEFAKQVQNSIMPQNRKYNNAIKLTSGYIPSEEMSGDSMDMFEIGNNAAGFYISDVSGHGITASILTMFIRQVIRGIEKEAFGIKDIIGEIIKQYKQLNLNSEQYFTLLYAVYDIHKKEMKLINAGHNCMPLLITKEGIIEEIEIKGMPVCHLAEERQYDVLTVKLNRGDRILFYTDGITEVYDESSGTFLEKKGLMEICEKKKDLESEKLIETIIQTAINYSYGGIRDDIAIAVLDIL